MSRDFVQLPAAYLIEVDGLPDGVVDPQILHAAALLYTYEVALAAGDPDQLAALATKYRTRFGAAVYGLLAAEALFHIAQGIIAPIASAIHIRHPELILPHVQQISDLRAKAADLLAEFEAGEGR